MKNIKQSIPSFCKSLQNLISKNTPTQMIPNILEPASIGVLPLFAMAVISLSYQIGGSVLGATFALGSAGYTTYFYRDTIKETIISFSLMKMMH